MQLRVAGSGVRALREFLTENGFNIDKEQADIEPKITMSDGLDSMTTLQIRKAHSILSKLRNSKKSDRSLVSFLINRSKVIIHEKVSIRDAPSEEKRAQLKVRRKKLQCMEEEALYDRMTHNVKHLTATAEIQQSIKSVRSHLTTGINMIVARITMFVVGYMISAALTDHETTVLLAYSYCTKLTFLFDSEWYSDWVVRLEWW